jgi:hypothetical protein
LIDLQFVSESYYPDIEEEIKEKIPLENKAFYTNQDLFENKLLSKKSKLTDVPHTSQTAVPYVCEMWVLKGT